MTHISNGEPLPINGAEADPPLSGVPPGQLGDLVRSLPGSVRKTPEIATIKIRSLDMKKMDRKEREENVEDKDESAKR